MRRTPAAVGTTIFFALAPGTVAGLLPWWITRWEVGGLLASAPSWVTVPSRLAGAALVLAGTVVLVRAFARFVVEGLGTPAPIAPTEHLVVGGLYGHVRNPMYVAVFAIIVGQALLLGCPVLLLYAAVTAVPIVAFVRRYEEPALRRAFGAEYEGYRAAVPGWWPRSRAYEAPSSGPCHRPQGGEAPEGP
ncbi:methyltransferase family protein [Streptosporangium sp. NPDC002721]|uniref:methyltransferase family protein n=1 Tax=Streptosporangium sp. NPDC002721 TaxID=3366188 RepID=UPI0036A5B857